MKKVKVVIVMPAYNAQKTLEKTLRDIPAGLAQQIILVDDASRDQTALLAKKLGLKVYRHRRNRGYGANQKTCYRLALRQKADIIVMLHPDYQYDPRLIPHLVSLIQNNYFDIMLGSRIRSRQEALDSGMPKYKYLANRLLTLAENLLSGQNLSEWHSGLRAFHSSVLKNIKFSQNSDDFVFDSQILFQAIEKGFRIGEISIPARYHPDSSSINFLRSLKYGFQTLGIAIAFFIKKLWTTF